MRLQHYLYIKGEESEVLMISKPGNKSSESQKLPQNELHERRQQKYYFYTFYMNILYADKSGMVQVDVQNHPKLLLRAN